MSSLRKSFQHRDLPQRIAAVAERLADEAFTPQSDDRREQQFRTLFQAGLPLLAVPLLVFVLGTLWLAAGGRITSLTSWLVLATSAAGALVLLHFCFAKIERPALLASLALGALATLLSSLVYDTSIDGQHYHFQATYALAGGWNPYWDAPIAPPVIGDPITLWAVHYPRAGWIVSAVLLAAGLPLAATKALNFLVFFASGALVAGALFRFGFSRPASALLASVAILSPIVLSQLFAAMNDGLLGLSILVFSVSMAAWVHFRDKAALAAGLAAMVLGLNLKFSAIPMFAIVGFFASAGAFALRGRSVALEVALILLCTAFAAVALIGWSPYVQNVLQFEHPFYPVMGPQAVDIMAGNTPVVLETLSAPQRFLYSLFAETHAGYETIARLKLPFVIAPGEFRAAGGVDVRIGGFGPLFSGIAVLAVVCAIASTVLLARESRKYLAVIALLLIAAAFLLSVLVMPQNWWARYVPQLWFVPLCVAAAAIATGRRSVQLLGTAITVIMLLDAAIVGGGATWLAGKRSAAAAAQIADLALTRQSYCVYPDMVQARIYLMREAGIPVRYSPRSALTCSSPQQIAGYGPDRFGGNVCECPP